MTQLDWNPILAPILSALVYVLAGFVGLLVTGLLHRIQAYLDTRGHAEASRIVADASVRMQAAMQNAAGEIALQIQAGKIDVSDLDALKAAAMAAAERIRGKLPDATATLQPAPYSIESGVLGKVTAAMPAPAPAPSAAPAPPIIVHTSEQSLSSESFQARAAIVKPRFMRDLGLLDFQAAGMIGSLGQESGLLAINEVNPIGGRGGFGWPQWTGPRRIAFENWCQANATLPTSQEANYQYMLVELRGSEAAALEALRQTTTIEEATRVFEEKFERASAVAMGRRLNFAEKAMAA